jgi:hypothetical protein
MFAKYVGRFRESDDGSLSVSKFVLENQVSQPPQLVDFVEVQNIFTSWDLEFGIDVHDSSHACNRGEMVKVTPITQKTS